MEIWLIQDGEKIGPFHDFAIRGKIERGEISEETSAWHEGLSAWMPLGKISLFEKEFTTKKDLPPPIPSGAYLEALRMARQENKPTPLVSNSFLARRFFARWFDLVLYSSLLLFSLLATGRDMEPLFLNIWFHLLYFLPLVTLEAYLIYRFGVTPGKWLLGIKVVNADGSLLTLSESMRRSLSVLFLGIGFGLGFFGLICMMISFFMTKKIGRSTWDIFGNHRLETTPITPSRISFFVIILISSCLLWGAVWLPTQINILKKQDPEFRAKWEESMKQMQDAKKQFQDEINHQKQTPEAK